MKKIFILSVLILYNHFSYSQTKEEKAQFRYVKDFHEKLENIKMDTGKELFWKYTYGDSSLTTLTKLSKVMEKEGLKTMVLGKSKTEKDMYELTIYEKKVYKNPKVLNERVTYLNSIVAAFNIIYNEATIGASKPNNTTYLEDYQPVGKDKKNE